MKRFTRTNAALLVALLGLALAPRAARAQVSEPIKPNILIITDTSASMLNAFPMNRCGYPGQLQPAGIYDRIGAAKCSIHRFLTATGDAEFGIARFKQDCFGPGNCAFRSCPGVLPNACCNATAGAGEMVVGVGPSNTAQLLSLVDDQGNGCFLGCGDVEIRSPNPANTPLGGSLLMARDYFENRVAGFESPIARDRASTPRYDACRPYRVILLTDGEETCLGDPQAAATALRCVCVGGQTCDCSRPHDPVTNPSRYEVKTYVIGFAEGMARFRQAMNRIAAAGGTTAHIPADTEDDLSTALSQTVQQSVLVELCNGVDDNCNGVVDEGFSKWCNRDAGQNTPFSCTAIADDCDGVDDNCVAGITDEPRNACGTCGAAPTEICDNVDNDCDGLVDEGACTVGCIPSPEICDGRDNDCDTRIDEGVSRSCGTCVVGMQMCVERTTVGTAGSWGTCSGSFGGPEICNNIDDDCDGVKDLIPQACGITRGQCVAGTELCINGIFDSTTCTAVGPSNEICNGLDDDCDNMTDEGDPGGGAACNDPAVCGDGTVRCQGGRLTCVSNMSAMPEVCDGMDNNCNGMVDEGIPSRGGCGSPVVGACQAGQDLCRSGIFQCIGYVGPRPEACNCLDDNCDGMDDNPPAGGSLCPVGSTCVSCQCALPCGTGEFPCPAGKRCESGFCIADPCIGITCPPDVDGTLNQCRAGRCVTACSLANCLTDEACKPTDGRCYPDNCVYFPGKCTGSQVCRNAMCVSDPCATVSCGGGEFCREGACVKSCAGLTCNAGEACRDGLCVTTGCSITCPAGRVCDPAIGLCVDDRCSGVICQNGQVCNPLTAQCANDPCQGVTCPAQQVCSGGNCFDPGQVINPDGGIETPADLQLQVAGSGGCVCRATGARGGPTPLTLLVAVTLGLTLWLRRRRS